MALKNVKSGDIIQAKTTNEQNVEIQNNERRIKKLEQEKAALTEMQSAINAAINDLREETELLIVDSVNSKVDDAYVEDGVAYFTSDGDVLFSLTGIGGGGGGGGGSTATMTCTNITGWATKTFAKGADVVLSLNWSSIDDGQATGDGTVTIYVGATSKTLSLKGAPIGVSQGDISVNVAKWLNDGVNVVKLTVTDVDGNMRSKTFNVSVQNLYIESSFDDSIIQTGEIELDYVPWGDISKTVHFSIDGTELPTVVTTSSGRQLTNTLPAQSHGEHSIDVWFEGVINEETIVSNVLHYNVICIADGDTTPIIASSYDPGTVNQYTTENIQFLVYDPTTQAVIMQVLMDNVQVTELTNVGREQQVYTYRFVDAGEHTLSFVCGSARKDIAITVAQSEITIEAETENLGLYLTSAGRNNSEAAAVRETWNFESVESTMTGFNWVSNGWVRDSDGFTALRINGGAHVTIPYQPFARDFRTSGKTIEFEFASRDVRNYEDVLIDCMNGGRGFQITAQSFRLASEQSTTQTQFKEDEHVRISIVVDKRSNKMRLIRCYINGILSGVVQYPDNDNFTQVEPVGITLGSNMCTLDVYNIRIYDNDLTAQQIENNWIADTQDGELMIERFTRNNLRNGAGYITIDKLPGDLPYMVISCAQLPQYKGDKKICSGYYVDPTHPEKSFEFTNCQIDVQGTSSQYYARKNYKTKFNGGFTHDGDTASKYKMRDDSIAVKTFCFKADVASSEGANNVELVRLYEMACPYRTPAQEANPKVRQGIDGFPIVIFWDDGNGPTFLGKYNFNNDKSTEDVFGFTNGDESWEIKNNTSDRVVFKNDDFRGKMWTNDFEARYPDTDPAYEDATQLSEFVSWVKSTDTTAATGATLAEPVVYPSIVTSYIEHEDTRTGQITYEEVKDTVNVTYTSDTAEYRLAKFRNELENYVELDSALFYYLFTELFLMVDSRAKNAFPSFIGTAIE